jgi:hypothetical protein
MTHQQPRRIYLDVPYCLIAGGRRDLDKFPRGSRGFSWDKAQRSWYVTTDAPPQLYAAYRRSGRKYFDVPYEMREDFKDCAGPYGGFDRDRKKWFAFSCIPDKKMQRIKRWCDPAPT